MIYKKTGKPAEKVLSLNDFSAGINFCDDSDTAIKMCENLEFDGSTLVTRAGLTAANTEIDWVDCKNNASVWFSGTTVFKNGQYHKVAIVRSTDEMSRIIYTVLLLNGNLTYTNIGSMVFTVVTGNEFNYPYAVTVFSGKAKKGDGIYALVSRVIVNAQDGDDDRFIQIFEHCEQSDGTHKWVSIELSETYRPVVLRNGRGGSYKLSEKELDTPEYPEKLNMLSNRFTSYFTSDGQSLTYTFPYKNTSVMTLTSVYCAVTLENGSKAVFSIAENKYSSKVTLSDNTEMTMYIDRDRGIIRFSDAWPYINAGANNIELSVGYKNTEFLRRMNGMNVATWYTAGSSGERLCLGGNDKYKSALCISEVGEPLYFPEKNCFFIGDGQQSVTGFAKINKSLVVFKEHEMYCGIYSSGKFTISHLHSSIGCDLPQTIVFCGNRVVWANTDRKIYTLNALSDYGSVAVYSMSDKISELLLKTPFWDACAEFYNNRYYLFVYGKAIVMDVSGAILQSNKEFLQSAVFTYFTLPTDISVKMAFAEKNGLNLICSGQSYHADLLYLCCFDKNKSADEYYMRDDTTQALIKKEQPIISSFKTNTIRGKNRHLTKCFNRLYINSYAENGLHVDYTADSGDIVRSADINMRYTGIKHIVPYRLFPLVVSDGMGISLKTDGRMKLSGYTLYYREYEV